jgi:RNA polymerase sigma factor (sigma-70 family)
MNAARAATMLGYLRRLGRTEEVRASSDANLLERYSAGREDAAFAELVRRHGPMVLGVCRRVLGNLDDAEDAFQATFLVLAARPRAVGKPASLANWLFGVARRTALRVQVDAARRYRHEQLSAKSEAISPDTETLWRDLRPVLDAEVARLPESYREVFILCCLESRTHEEAARLLGCPAGTVASRLSRARERLRSRLVRRGLALGAAGTLFAAGEAEAAVSSELLGILVRATAARTATTTVFSTAGSISPRVAALTEGVLRAMWITKLKVAAALVLAIGAAGFGAGFVLSTAAQPAPVPSAGQPVSPAGGAGDKGAGPREVVGPVKAEPPAPPMDPEAPEKEKKEKRAEPKAPLVSATAIEDAEFDVELMKARLDAKRAELEAAKATAEAARNDLKRASDLLRVKAMSQEEFERIHSAADAALAQVRIKEADLVEPEIRVRQATRRLVALREALGTDEFTGRPPAPKPADTKDASPKTADARDIVELMAAQLDVQRARSAAARQDLETVKATLANLKKAGRVVTEAENAQAEADVRTKEAQVHIRDAELAEAEVRLKQAKRRSDEITRPSSPAKDAECLEELEKKIDRLNKELEALKKRLPPEGKK